MMLLTIYAATWSGEQRKPDQSKKRKLIQYAENSNEIKREALQSSVSWKNSLLNSSSVCIICELI